MESYIERVTSGRPAPMKSVHPTHVYHGRAKMAMNLIPTVEGTLARVDIERAKLDAFLDLFSEAYPIKEHYVSGDHLYISLSKTRAPTKAWMDRLRGREFFVYHLHFNPEDWDYDANVAASYSSLKLLSTQIDRYEGIRVRDWIGSKTLVFGDLPKRS